MTDVLTTAGLPLLRLLPPQWLPNAQATNGSAPSEAGTFLDGMVEVNFVAVSIVVGIIVTALLLYLIRRLWPSRHP